MTKFDANVPEHCEVTLSFPSGGQLGGNLNLDDRAVRAFFKNTDDTVTVNGVTKKRSITSALSKAKGSIMRDVGVLTWGPGRQKKFVKYPMKTYWPQVKSILDNLDDYYVPVREHMEEKREQISNNVKDFCSIYGVTVTDKAPWLSGIDDAEQEALFKEWVKKFVPSYSVTGVRVPEEFIDTIREYSKMDMTSVLGEEIVQKVKTLESQIALTIAQVTGDKPRIPNKNTVKNLDEALKDIGDLLGHTNLAGSDMAVEVGELLGEWDKVKKEREVLNITKSNSREYSRAEAAAKTAQERIAKIVDSCPLIDASTLEIEEVAIEVEEVKVAATVQDNETLNDNDMGIKIGNVEEEVKFEKPSYEDNFNDVVNSVE